MRLLRLNNANRTSPVESVPPGIPANKSSRCLTAELGGPGARTSGRGWSHRSGLALGPNLWQRLGSSPRLDPRPCPTKSQKPRPTPCGAAGSPSSPSALMEAINASIGFDRRMAEQDIAGSLAHSAMLAEAGNHHPGGPGRDPSRACARSREIEDGTLRLLDCARRHPHERGEPAQGARRRARRRGCIRPGAGTTRWPSTSGCGCATPTTGRMRS